MIDLEEHKNSIYLKKVKDIKFGFVLSFIIFIAGMFFYDFSIIGIGIKKLEEEIEFLKKQ